jgi:hypothetical protein
VTAPAVIVERFDDVATWLAVRMSHQATPMFAIGASDVPAILGRSTFRGPWDVWTDHHGPRHDDPADEDDVRSRGHAVEPFLMAAYTEATGREVDDGLLVLSRDDVPWFRVSTDAYVPGDRVIEGKTYSYMKRDEWAGADHVDPVPVKVAVEKGLIPDSYSWQVVAQAAVADVALVDLVGVQVSLKRCRAVLASGEVVTEPAWIVEAPPVVVSVEVAASQRAWIVDTVGEWRERHLVQGIEPDPDGSKAQIRAYRQRMSPGAVPAWPEIRAAASDLVMARAASKEAKARETEAKGRILALLGEDTSAVEPDDPKAWICRARKTKRGLTIDAR